METKAGIKDMKKQSFGVNEQGEPVSLYMLENDHLTASFSDYGATFVSLVDKSTGIDVLLGFDSIEGYINHDAHIGGFIGRTANRIKDAAFELNGVRYEIQKNNNGNNLHGGTDGFDRVMYEVTEQENAVIFHRLSPDGEMGYPGNLDVKVTYTLLDDGVEMKAEGKAMDQDTLFAMTNHNYYNLDGSNTILNHKVMIPAETYLEDTEDGVSHLPFLSVEGTAFDFRQFKSIGKNINDPDPQLIDNRGYDHHWRPDGEGMRVFAVCEGEQLRLTVSSNLPGMHVYTGNFLDTAGKGGKQYTQHSGVCFEPEYVPNGINYEGVDKPVVKAGETSVQIITMRLERK